jgi:hypothetical protein
LFPSGHGCVVRLPKKQLERDSELINVRIDAL